MIPILILALTVVSPLLAQPCQNAKISDVKTYSTRDTILNSVTNYVVEFRAQCSGLHTKNLIFYTEVKSKTISSSSDESGEKYQLTWTDRNELSRSGQIDLKIYDEDGFTALKKAQRLQADASQVREVKTVSFYHATSYRGPTIQIELAATIIAGAIYYWAYTTKNNLMA